MEMTKRKATGAALAVALGLAGCGLLMHPVGGDKLAAVARAAEDSKGPAADKAHRAAKVDLMPESFANLHALIRPHKDEWRHLKVQWLTDVVAVRQKAAAEDKPIIICYTGGAGYNEPLGIC
jgi:hypothetical protein